MLSKSSNSKILAFLVFSIISHASLGFARSLEGIEHDFKSAQTPSGRASSRQSALANRDFVLDKEASEKLLRRMEQLDELNHKHQVTNEQPSKLVAGETSDNSLNCPICLYPMADTSTTETPCGHSFHAECIERWLAARKKGKPGKCPVCRNHIVEPEPIEHEERKASEENVRQLGHPNDSIINPDGSTTEILAEEAPTQRPVRQIGAVFDHQASIVLDGQSVIIPEPILFGSGFVSSEDIINDSEAYQRVLDDLRAQYDNEDH